jgi:hypothetical protein
MPLDSASGISSASVASMEVEGAMEPVGGFVAGLADILVVEGNAAVVQQEVNVVADDAVGLDDHVPLFDHVIPAAHNVAEVQPEAAQVAGNEGLGVHVPLPDHVIPAVNVVVGVLQEAAVDAGIEGMGDAAVMHQNVGNNVAAAVSDVAVGLVDGSGPLIDQPEVSPPVDQDVSIGLVGPAMGLGESHGEGQGSVLGTHVAIVVGQEVPHVSSVVLQAAPAAGPRLDINSEGLRVSLAPDCAANPKKRSWSDPIAEQVESFRNVLQSDAAPATARHEKSISVSSLSKNSPSVQHVVSEFVEFQAMDAPVPAKRGRPKKSSTPVVNLTPRMKTCSQSNLQGFKAKPVLGVEVKRRKKCSKVLNVSKEVVVPVSPDRMEGNVPKENVAKTPPVPVPMLQNIGGILGIDPWELTVEKLLAPSENVAPPSAVNNDD